MILKGNQRGGGRQMALHLLNEQHNDHITVHEVRGFMTSDVLGALNEAYALSKGTKCKQFMYSLSLNPPQNENVPISTFEKTLERIEKKLGLNDQPRVVVFHEKEGRRHCHSVWSRIDSDEMKAINMSHDRTKLNDISKSLFLEHGWSLPDGFKDKAKKNPLNYTREEWQQAARIGRKPTQIKQELQECWAVSDDKRSFESALKENGYYLAKGDRRGYVVLDLHGEVYSLSRQLGRKQKDLTSRLGETVSLPSVSEAKAGIAKQLSDLFKRYSDELAAQHKKAISPLLHKKQEMTAQHRKRREKLDQYQQKRWQEEELKRSARIRRGFKGLWDKLNGRYWKTRKANERECWNNYQRDLKQREDLIREQLTERQELQAQLNLLREEQNQERRNLIRDLSQVTEKPRRKEKSPPERQKSRETKFRQSTYQELERDDGPDFEPEL